MPQRRLRQGRKASTDAGCVQGERKEQLVAGAGPGLISSICKRMRYEMDVVDAHKNERLDTSSVRCCRVYFAKGACWD
eukprot:1846440-Pleurochrysis_carterae.AAC.1